MASSFSALERGQLLGCFRLLDACDRGSLGPSDLATAYRRIGLFFEPHELQALIERVDRSGSGRLGFEELLELMELSSTQTAEELLATPAQAVFETLSLAIWMYSAHASVIHAVRESKAWVRGELSTIKSAGSPRKKRAGRSPVIARRAGSPLTEDSLEGAMVARLQAREIEKQAKRKQRAKAELQLHHGKASQSEGNLSGACFAQRQAAWVRVDTIERSHAASALESLRRGRGMYKGQLATTSPRRLMQIAFE
ncbi:MAG: hypothetical protein SGPRY_013362, partial [Prymnesium sp.]